MISDRIARPLRVLAPDICRAALPLKVKVQPEMRSLEDSMVEALFLGVQIGRACLTDAGRSAAAKPRAAVICKV